MTYPVSQWHQWITQPVARYINWPLDGASPKTLHFVHKPAGLILQSQLGMHITDKLESDKWDAIQWYCVRYYHSTEYLHNAAQLLSTSMKQTSKNFLPMFPTHNTSLDLKDPTCSCCLSKKEGTYAGTSCRCNSRTTFDHQCHAQSISMQAVPRKD